MPDDWIRIGTISSVHPAQRQVRARSEAGCRRQFRRMLWVRLALREGAPLRCKVDSVRVEEEMAIIALASGVPRDTVARVKGAAVVVAPDEWTPASKDDYEVVELQEFEVLDRDGRRLGRIVETYESGAQGAIEVEEPGGRSFLLPVIDKVVADIDFVRRIVSVGDFAAFAVACDGEWPNEEER